MGIENLLSALVGKERGSRGGGAPLSRKNVGVRVGVRIRKIPPLLLSSLFLLLPPWPKSGIFN